MVEMVIKGTVMQRPPPQASIQQGSLVSLILFAMYTSGFEQCIEQRVTGVKGLSFVDNVRCATTGSDITYNVRTLEACTRETTHWVETWELQCDTTKTEAEVFTSRQGHKMQLHLKRTGKITVGNSLSRFNKGANRWLGVCTDNHLTFKEHHN